MKILIGTLFFVFLANSIFAKDDVVVTAKGDTLRGKVSLQTGDANANDKLVIKIDRKRKYLPAYKVRNIALENGEKYRTIKLSERYQFVKVIIDGSYLSYCMYVDETAIDKNNFSEPLLITIDGQQHAISFISFKSRILNFLADCEEVSGKISSGEYKRKDIEKIIVDYNACIDAKSNSRRAVLPNSDKGVGINRLIEAIRKEAIFENKTDLIEMLEDVKNKIQTGKAVPSYLNGAIAKAMTGHEDWLKMFESALE